MWERLTINLVKKYGSYFPQSQSTVATKQRLNIIVSEEVAEFLDQSVLTDKSLRQLEVRIERILASEFRLAS